MDTYCIYRPSGVSLATSRVQIQEAVMALLPLRSLLLLQHPQLRLYLADPFKSCDVRRVLLSCTWIPRERSHNMEKQPGLS